MPPGGIRTHDLSRLAAADLRLRPRGYWDRQVICIFYVIIWFLPSQVTDFIVKKPDECCMDIETVDFSGAASINIFCVQMVKYGQISLAVFKLNTCYKKSL